MKHILYEWQLPTSLERSTAGQLNSNSMRKHFSNLYAKRKLTNVLVGATMKLYTEPAVSSLQLRHNFYTSI